MAPAVTSATTSVHLDDPTSIAMTAIPRAEVGPFIVVRLGSVASLLVHDLAVLDALAVEVLAARNVLAALLADEGQITTIAATLAADQQQPVLR